MSANIPRCCYNERENNKTKPSVCESVIAVVYFGQTSVTFAGDLAAVRNSGVLKAGVDCISATRIKASHF